MFLLTIPSSVRMKAPHMQTSPLGLRLTEVNLGVCTNRLESSQGLRSQAAYSVSGTLQLSRRLSREDFCLASETEL